MSFENSFNDFENSFGDSGFDEIVIDATPQLKLLKGGLWMGSLVALVVGIILLVQVHQTGILADKPFVLPLLGLMGIMAMFHVGTRYCTYINSFPEVNSLVFSSAGLKVPAFIARKFSLFREVSKEKLAPVFIPWREISSMEYIFVGKQRTEFLRIKLEENAHELTQFNIPKKIIASKLPEIEAFLKDHNIDKYPDTEKLRKLLASRVTTLLKFVPLISFIFIGLFAVIFVMSQKTDSVEQTDNVLETHFTPYQKQEAVDWASPQHPVLLPTIAPDEYKIEKWSNGNLKSKEPLVNGQLNGIAEYRYDNGQIYGLIPYLDGNRHGSFSLYREDGSLEQELRYKEGRVHGIQHWTNPEQTWLYIDDKPVENLK